MKFTMQNCFARKETILYNKPLKRLVRFLKKKIVYKIFYELYNEGSKKYNYIKEGFSFYKIKH